jgi:site-specific recombinase XerD
MIKYSLALVLWTADPNTRGQYPIYIRITISRVRRYIATGIFLPQKMWSDHDEAVRSAHPLAPQYNADLAARKQKIIQYISEHQVQGKALAAQQVKDHFTGSGNMQNIFEFVDAFIEECRGKKTDSTLENYRKHALRLELFHGSRQLSFEDITPEYLGRYERHLRSPKKEGAKPVDGNYVHALWRTMKTWFNAAKRKDLTTNYPFDKYENPIYEGPTKDFLTLRELKAWEEYAGKVTDEVDRQTAIYFLLGCYTGLRISDWFAFRIKDHVSAGRIRLRAKKNGEWVTMPISAPLYRNLARMEACPLTITEPAINRSLKDIARELKLKKRITTHTGRHTFAITICGDRGISAETCSELMGITISTCVINYYRVTNRKIDKETLTAWEGL